MSDGKHLIKGLFLGAKETLPNGQESAIRKKSVESIKINFTHISDDAIVDQVHHGGEMRVIHHYSQYNYHILKNKFPDIANRFQPGSFGENILTEELTEKDLFIGDIYQLGSAKVQLTVARRPCATINQSYQDSRVLKEVMSTGHVGWFYKVLEEGSVKLGDYLEFIERPFPNLKVSDLYDQGYAPGAKFKNRNFLNLCLATGLMDKGWKPKVEKALTSLP